ncbi:MAG: histidine phosphatase family protein [Candidatus Omnitrophica bacterium]|nr:histidine phosphatase family protein [Candidatus Omnitrophota bacterium]
MIRHGETDWTLEKRYQGDTDIPLNAKGKHNIQNAARWISQMKIDFLYSSMLLRARMSSGIIGKAIRKKAVADKRINEICFGVWEGKTGDDLWKEKDRAFMRWSKGEWVTPTGGEKISDFRKRVSHFLKAVLKRHPGKTVAIISHGGAIKMMIMEALKLSYRSLWMMRVDPASVSALNFFPDFNQLALLNYVPSLAPIKKGKKGKEGWR